MKLKQRKKAHRKLHKIKNHPRERLHKEVASPLGFIISQNDWIVGEIQIITEDYTMDKYIYDENNGLWYELQGEYYLPCLTLPPEEEKFIGIWGQRHLRYIKPKYFSKKSFNLSMTVCFFKALFEPPENLEIGGNILSRSVPVVFIPPSLNEFSINF